MTYVPLSEAKDKLSSLIDETLASHEIVHITKHGRPAAVLMSEDDLESLHETLFWLSQPGIRESIEQADRERREGGAIDTAALREKFGLAE